MFTPTFISTSTGRFMHRTKIRFVQPQPNSKQNKNNPIGCGTVPGNLVSIFSCQLISYIHHCTTFLAWRRAYDALHDLGLVSASMFPYPSKDIFSRIHMVQIGPGVLACTTRGGRRSKAGHCFHLLYFFKFFYFFLFFFFLPSPPSTFHPLWGNSRDWKLGITRSI